ncbi:hypothetical protein PIB30_116548, partial [Stylosanthes scabra]|nr:hypothetical protein [Stylosanthes scabra]
EGRQGRIRFLGAQRRVMPRDPAGDRGGGARRRRAVSGGADGDMRGGGRRA